MGKFVDLEAVGGRETLIGYTEMRCRNPIPRGERNHEDDQGKDSAEMVECGNPFLYPFHPAVLRYKTVGENGNVLPPAVMQNVFLVLCPVCKKMGLVEEFIKADVDAREKSGESPNVGVIQPGR